MDWRAVTFDWNQARAFLVTAEEGSLSAAARALKISQPTLGRQVSALEKALGVSLFERSGRGLKLTPSGSDLLEHVRAMGAAANDLSLNATGRSKALEGSVRIAASEMMSALVLPALLRKLRLRYQRIQIEIIASDGVSDLKRREADIALRFYSSGPKDPDLIGKKVGSSTGRLYATPAYLARLGAPITELTLQRADFIASDDTDLYIKHLNKRGLSLSQANFAVRAANSLVQWELTKQGVGIGVMPEALADNEPGVVRVLPDFPPFHGELWIVAHRELRASRRIRAVFDFLAKELSERQGFYDAKR